MIVTYLDLKTGKKSIEGGVSIFALIEDDWSCDCNRALAFGDDGILKNLMGFLRTVAMVTLDTS